MTDNLVDLSKVAYKKCKRCLDFGIVTWHPQADAIYGVDSNRRIKFLGYKRNKSEHCKPCQRDMEQSKSSVLHWKLIGKSRKAEKQGDTQ